jgi:hypothetical protein
MLLPKNKYRAFGYFGMAIFYYAVFTMQVLTGMIPRGTGDPAKYYAENTGFFWTYIAVGFLVMLYQLSRGAYLYWARLRRDTDPPSTKGFTPRTAAVITSLVAIPLGLLLLILPIAEIVKGTAYGGYAMGNHSLTAGAPAFWSVFVFHVLVAAAPIVGGSLLFIFPPRHTEAVAAPVVALPVFNGTSALPVELKPKMKTWTKVLVGSLAGVVLLGVVAIAALVGGVYYVYQKVDNPELRKKTDAAKTAGMEFAKNTDQNGCMEKAYTLEVPADTFDMSNHYFAKSCLKASRVTPNFCDGVPVAFDREWFNKQCDVPGRPREACVVAYTAKRDFCRLD